MAKRNNTNAQKTLEYLFEIAQRIPGDLGKRKCKEFIEVAQRHQIRLGMFKRIICKRCYTILTPKVASDTYLEKRENGFGVLIKCKNCYKEYFTVNRGK